MNNLQRAIEIVTKAMALQPKDVNSYDDYADDFVQLLQDELENIRQCLVRYDLDCG